MFDFKNLHQKHLTIETMTDASNVQSCETCLLQIFQVMFIYIDYFFNEKSFAQSSSQSDIQFQSLLNFSVSIIYGQCSWTFFLTFVKHDELSKSSDIITQHLFVEDQVKQLAKDEFRLRQLYRKHNTYVINTVPKENLLVWNLKDGWEPLCKFLNKPIPG